MAEDTGLSKSQVEKVFESMNDLIQGHLQTRGSGEFTIPMTGIKIKRVRKKATKARQMTSPLTNEEVTISAKPARDVVRLSALKVLKEKVVKEKKTKK